MTTTQEHAAPSDPTPADPAPGLDPLAAAVVRAETAEAEAVHLKDQLLRALAEQENLRRRHQRELDELRKFAVGQFAGDIVGAADNLRRALDAAPADRSAMPDSVKALIDGIGMVERDLLGLFERHGLSRIDPRGLRFDPAYHQPMLEVDPSDAVLPGHVAQVLQAGWSLNGRCLRPALVAVARGTAANTVDTKV